MPMRFSRLAGASLLAGTLALLPCVGLAAEEPSQPEQLPLPRKVPQDSKPSESPLFIPFYYRTSRYDVWQFYAPDRRGWFRPRVIYSPYGSFYLYNGEPYLWVTTHDLDWMPYVVH